MWPAKLAASTSTSPSAILFLFFPPFKIQVFGIRKCEPQCFTIINCHRCLQFWKPIISLSSSRCSIISQVCNNKSSAIAATMSTGPSSATDATSTESMKPKKKDPWLIVGLGNPSKDYAGTRHNVDFEMVDAIAEAEEIPMSSVSFKGPVWRRHLVPPYLDGSYFSISGFIGDVPVMLAKPQTFMNSSGESVGGLVSCYKIPFKQVLVIFDDLDLPFAKLRLLPKGGHGGQNGMRSIINHFKGNVDFPRLRIGIGRPPGKMDSV